MLTIIPDLISVNNFTVGRKGWTPDRIVIHVTEGSEQAAESWFDADVSDVSSNYIVSKLGVIKQEVLEKDSAWAQGRVFEPTAKVVKERVNVNPNYYCISIEHEGTGNEDLTDIQRMKSGELIADIIKRNPKITFDRDHILKHHEIFAKKTCPGKIDINKLMEVAGHYLNIAQTMLTPKVVYSDYFKDYLIVTKYVSDTEWYFVPFQQLVKGSSVRAQTSLSQMPASP